jgi:carotenoid isomerooxygenase
MKFWIWAIFILFYQGKILTLLFEKFHRSICSVPNRWKLHMGYVHSFGVTDNYFIIVEQPWALSLIDIFSLGIRNIPFINSFKWFPNEHTHFYLVDRETKSLKYTFKSKAFAFYHIINQFEKDGHVIIDIPCFEDPSLMNCFMLDAMKNFKDDLNFSKSF